MSLSQGYAIVFACSLREGCVVERDDYDADDLMRRLALGARDLSCATGSRP